MILRSGDVMQEALYSILLSQLCLLWDNSIIRNFFPALMGKLLCYNSYALALV